MSTSALEMLPVTRDVTPSMSEKRFDAYFAWIAAGIISTDFAIN
jgi:hypothetical protein